MTFMFASIKYKKKEEPLNTGSSFIKLS